MARKLLIVDVEPTRDLMKATPKELGQAAVRGELAKLTGSAFVEYGRNLDTIDRARAWLTDQRNWFSGQMFIVKWDGLTPTVCASHGEKLIREYWDDGLPSVVVIHQRNVRSGAVKDVPEVPDVIE